MRRGFFVLFSVSVVAVAAIAAQNIKATPIDQVRADVAQLRDDVKALRERVDRLEGKNMGAGDAPADAAKIARALRDKKIVSGMTYAQVKQVCGEPAEVMEQGERGDVYRWTLTSDQQVMEGMKPTREPVGQYSVIVHFRNGRATTFERIDHGQPRPGR